MIFKGSYEHTLDSKGRMFIPAKFREGLGDNFVIFKWVLDKCLYVMSNEAFENFSAELDKMPMADEDAALIERVLYPSASDMELDAQKRILIPADLRNYANLEKDVAVVGVRSRVELWDLETWRTKSQEDSNKVKSSLGNLRGRGHNI
jgi:MraZ protein